MTLLQDRKEKNNSLQNAQRAEKAAIRAENEHKWDLAREYWEVKSRWHRLEKDLEQERATKMRIAETYVMQAEDEINSELSPRYSLASARINSAIESLRRIGNTQERVRDLHNILLSYQEKAVDELVPFSSSTDITEIVNIAREKVKGKPLLEALILLAGLGSSPKVADLKKQATENDEKFLFKQLFPTVRLNSKGRVIAHQPTNKEESIQADMFHDAQIRHQFFAQLVEYVRMQIALEHTASLFDFLPLVSNHPFIPPGRELIIARGLQAGLRGDFLTSSHFLIPQIEASVRYILSHLKIIASGLDDDGIQDEFNLNKTLSDSKFTIPLASVLGDDFVFDLRGLLVERFGSNLRNDLAHGLLDHDEYYSSPSVYLWWLSLRFYSWQMIAKLQRTDIKATEE